MCWFRSEVEKKESDRQIKRPLILQSFRLLSPRGIAGVQGGGVKNMNINRSRVNIEHNIVIYLLSSIPHK